MREAVDVIMAILLGAAGFIDMKTREITVHFLVVLTGVAILSACIQGETWTSILGGIGIGLIFLILSKCTREQIGYGDSWLILILGIYAGMVNVIWILFAASLGASIFSIVFCALHKWNRRYSIPFIPFMAAAFVGVILI